MADILRGRSIHCKVRCSFGSLGSCVGVMLMVLVLGVMRFLQTEWHRHERDRNAWEIERAEMKSRIGRLEGDVRTNKRLRESLAKHVRLLEAALKKEREKVKKLTNNEEVDDMRDPKEIARESLSAVKCIIPFGSHVCASVNVYLLQLSTPGFPIIPSTSTPMRPNPNIGRRMNEISRVFTCPSVRKRSRIMSSLHRTRLRNWPSRIFPTISTEANQCLSRAWRKPICSNNDRSSSSSISNSSREIT